jgi:hypothetical protein
MKIIIAEEVKYCCKSGLKRREIGFNFDMSGFKSFAEVSIEKG